MGKEEKETPKKKVTKEKNENVEEKVTKTKKIEKPKYKGVTL